MFISGASHFGPTVPPVSHTPYSRRLSMTPPSLADLTARFLAAKAALPESDEPAEVMPHEVVTGFRADAAATWADAKAAFDFLGATGLAVTMPPDWGTFLTQLPDATVLPLCLGAVPQRMRDLSHVRPLARDGRATVPAAVSQALTKWVESKSKVGSPADRLVAAALLRVKGEYDRAGAVHDDVAPDCAGPLATVLANERAALKWARGDEAGAAAAWDAMAEGPVARFNRGVCHWRAGRTAEAAKAFDKAAATIPDRSGWAHLAAFYASSCEGDV
jgi:hypothetical protein